MLSFMKKDRLDEIVQTIPLKDLPLLDSFSPGRLEEGVEISDHFRVVFRKSWPPKVIPNKFLRTPVKPLAFKTNCRQKIPFGTLTFSDIGEYLEDFVCHGNKEDMVYFHEFEEFVKTRDVFASIDGQTQNCRSENGWKIFKSDGADTGEITEKTKTICVLSENADPENSFSVNVKKIDQEKNVLSLMVHREPNDYCPLIIPLNYARSMTRAEMSDRLGECFKKEGGWSVFSGAFQSLMTLELTMGFFERRAREIIIQSHEHEINLFYHRNKKTGKQELFMQKIEGRQLGPIGMIDTPLPGKEEKAREKFIGGLILKGRYPVRSLDVIESLER